MTAREAFVCYRPHVLIGCALVAMCTAAPSLTFWLMPVVVGLLLAPWMVLLTSRRDLGLWAQRIGVFATPEECVPPSLLVEQEAEQDNVVQLDRKSTRLNSSH